MTGIRNPNDANRQASEDVGTGPQTWEAFSRRDATAAEEKEWGQALVRFCARPHTERNSRRGQLPISEPNTSVT